MGLYCSAGECDGTLRPVGCGRQWGHCPTGFDGFLRHGTDTACPSGRACGPRLGNAPGCSRHGHGFHPPEPGTLLYGARVDPQSLSTYSGTWTTTRHAHLYLARQGHVQPGPHISRPERDASAVSRRSPGGREHPPLRDRREGYLGSAHRAH